VTISVSANVGCSEDTSRAIENGAEGAGLYRIERAYLGRVSPPNSEELPAEMKQTLAPARGRPVCVRLLDIGGDKPLLFMRFMAETNPSLGRAPDGLRGARGATGAHSQTPTVRNSSGQRCSATGSDDQRSHPHRFLWPSPRPLHLSYRRLP
jgi:phosphoenolpyruvate synthase/pyruvate phosphate dikinase